MISPAWASHATRAAPAASTLVAGVLQRQCACGQHTVGGGMCESCANQQRPLQRKATRAARGEAPPIVHAALRTGGQPLDRLTRAFMEARLGHDFTPVRSSTGATPLMHVGLAIGSRDDGFEREADRAATRIDHSVRPEAAQEKGRPDFRTVRIHTGPLAQASARAIGAKAYTVGHNIVFGAAAYAPYDGEGRRLLAHELTHVLQQTGPGAAGSVIVQRAGDPVEDIRSLLSYGILDWAITDSEAMQALALLGTIPPADLPGALKRLGSKYVTRLLDNLPDAAKSGDIYRRVIETLGPAGIMPYATDQLSYGLFDWAITDAEVTRVFNMFVNLAPPAQEQFLSGLDANGRLGRLIDNSNSAHHGLYIRPWIATLSKGALTEPQRKILKSIVANTSDDELATLKLATEIRFDVHVIGQAKVEWSGDLLRRTYLVLNDLPEAHVAQNKELVYLAAYKQSEKKEEGNKISMVPGRYTGGTETLQINMEAREQGESSDGNVPPGAIRETITHETGHSVDKKMGWSDGTEPAKPERGGWKIYKEKHVDCSGEMVADSNGEISKLVAAQRADVVNEMATTMQTAKPDDKTAGEQLDDRIGKLAWFAALKNKAQVLKDRALAALKIGLDQPWFKAKDGGEHLKDHVYEWTQYPDKGWARYLHAARKNIVQPYQFRSPGEWFAVAYAAYYAPDERGKGAKLNDHDPDTKKYFDTVVDKLAPSPGTKP